MDNRAIKVLQERFLVKIPIEARKAVVEAPKLAGFGLGKRLNVTRPDGSVIEECCPLAGVIAYLGSPFKLVAELGDIRWGLEATPINPKEIKATKRLADAVDDFIWEWDLGGISDSELSRIFLVS